MIERRRVVHIISSSRMGGAQEYLLMLVRGLLWHGDLVTVVCPDGPFKSRVREIEGVEVLNMPSTLASLISLKKTIGMRKPRVIHAHLLGAACVGAFVGYGLKAVQMVYTVHNLIVYPGMAKWKEHVYPTITRMVVKRYHLLVAVSYHISRHLRENAKIYHPNVHVVHNGVECDAIKEKVKANNIIIGACIRNTVVVGAIGRLSYQKGYDVLIRAMKIVAQTQPNVRCKIFGEGPCEKSLRKQILDLEIGDVVELCGYTQTPISQIAGFDIFAMPSRFEGLPLVLLEALAVGVPVIATSVGGIPEVLDGDYGCMIPPNDHVSLATMILRLCTNIQLRKQFSQKGMSRVMRDFSCQKNVSVIRGLYYASPPA
jgi:glycosyltransferase involved in cell wall biosynthesis